MTEPPLASAHPASARGGPGAASLSSVAPACDGAEKPPDVLRNRPSSLAVICLLDALAVCLVAVGHEGARVSAAWAPYLYWTGLLLVVVPSALRLCSDSVTEGEALGIVTLATAALYLAKVSHSPSRFTFMDELLHHRALLDVLATGRLFQPNALLPAARSYPVLSAVGAFAARGNVSPVVAGLAVIGAARLLLAWSLFSLYRRMGGSPRVAGLASIVYMANPNSLYFQAMFSYESIAIPLGLTAVALLALAQTRASRALAVALATAIAGVAVAAHHVSGFALAAFLALWTCCALCVRPRRRVLVLAVPTAVTVVTVGLWTVVAAPDTIGYLAPVFRSAGAEVATAVETLTSRGQPAMTAINRTTEANGGSSAKAVRGTAAKDTASSAVRPGWIPARRRMFQNYAGEMAPVAERLAGIGGVLLTVLLLVPGLWVVWARRQTEPLLVACALSAAVYPLTLMLRVTLTGTDIPNRASELLYVGVGIVVALGIEWLWLARPTSGRGPALSTVSLAILFVSGVIVSWPPWARMPGSYRVIADSRSIDAHGVGAAAWALDHLGPEQRMIADRIQMRLMGALGRQRPVTLHTDHLSVAAVLFDRSLGEWHRAIIRAGRIRYLVVDRRITWGLPLDGVYVEEGEPDTFAHTRPLDPASLDKFDRLPLVDRIYDSGPIQIYDIAALGHATDHP